MAQTLSEQFVAQLNENVFFAEFAFTSNQLRIEGVGEVELADHLVILDDVALIFQLKERSHTANSDAGSLSSWFAKKVRKAAVKQVAETKAMLQDFAATRIRNQREHDVKLPAVAPTQICSIVIYHAPEPADFYPPKHCESRSAGFVHFIAARDYFGICEFLVTPVEVLDYLTFREHAVKSLSLAPAPVSEAALVGQFMGGDLRAIPHERYSMVFDALIQDRDNWDISFLTQNLGEQITYREGDNSDTSHYRILTQLAKLTRSELRELKTRLRLTLEAVRADEFRLPYRFAVRRNDCGFLFLPVQTDMHQSARQALQNFSLASKHELKVTKHVSLSVCKAQQFIDIEWMYVDGPVTPNPEIDALLAQNYPFRKLKEELKPRYEFEASSLRDAIGDHG
jgi:hypothetical protein